MDRTELAAFLRTRRARLRPSDVGLPGGDLTHRRTPGLRRQEVAHLAGISVEYYVRLEQARSPRPSRQVLAGLARALMLTGDERTYLFRIVGENPPAAIGPSTGLLPAVRYLLDSLRETPAYVVNARYDVLAWNPMATHFIGDLSAYPLPERNMIRWSFSRVAEEHIWSNEGALNFTRATVADLRAAYAQYPNDPGVESLVTELLGTSARFAQLWEEREVAVRRGMVKRIDHPAAGALEFECQQLRVTDTDQTIIVYCAAPGSPTEAAFRRLAALPPTGASSRPLAAGR
ncbi:transcriptional regulator [Catellatospora sp. TT07R-123]|uniref:helix-turn-helix transcriptional regulator n=1 Tax=Catellatospora sp. TT07R-123 TaxID=2733863 RepID=UPI001B09E9F2|nr:helix-turn-helix transcriptional regulator [Catellatospora sp. TT07R-123]GHJ49017.1 transcriptional regulator [Catellatospora sp. TT07R-123]